MNEIGIKILLAGSKFMSEMHLKQPGFTCSACRILPKNKQKNQKFKETEESQYINQTKRDKASF